MSNDESLIFCSIWSVTTGYGELHESSLTPHVRAVRQFNTKSREAALKRKWTNSGLNCKITWAKGSLSHKWPPCSDRCTQGLSKLVWVTVVQWKNKIVTESKISILSLWVGYLLSSCWVNIVLQMPLNAKHPKTRKHSLTSIIPQGRCAKWSSSLLQCPHPLLSTPFSHLTCLPHQVVDSGLWVILSSDF